MLAPSLFVMRFKKLRVRLRWGRAQAWIRVTFLVLVVGGAASWLILRKALARVGEGTLGLVREADDLQQKVGLRIKSLQINGSSLRLGTALVSGRVTPLLDRFELACRRESDDFVESLVDAQPAGHGEPKPPKATRGHPLLRQERPIVREGVPEGTPGGMHEGMHEGMIVCFTAAPDVNGAGGGWTAFLRTRDLASLGQLVLLYARQVADEKVHVLMVRPDGPFPLMDLFPATGDAPGSDSVLSARPRSARRILSGVAEGAPYALRVYESSNPASTVIAQLTEDMTRLGFEAIRDPALPPEVHGFIHAAGFHSLAVVTETDGRSTVSIADLGSSAPTR